MIVFKRKMALGIKINLSGLLGPRRACESLIWRLNGNVLAMKFDFYL